jgi:DNA-binding transcriptional ArsR family regulator
MATPRIDEIGRLIGDPTRATILDVLMDGRAWTGRELARFANVTPSTASEHLQRLVEGSLVTVLPSGKYRYYRLASAEIAAALEGLMLIAARTPKPDGRSPIDPTLRRARTCYDHLAGELGVALADALVGRGAVVFGDRDAEVTPAGAALFAELGLTITGTQKHRALCRPCLDWSERRFHLAGQCGAALARCALEREWVEREAGTRAVSVTTSGVRALSKHFDIAWTP